MDNKNNNVRVKVIGIINPKGEWVGNIVIDVDNLEVENYLKNGYSVEKPKKYVVEDN